MARRGTQGRIGARLITTVLTHYTHTNDWETHTHLPHEQTRTATATPSNEQSNIHVSALGLGLGLGFRNPSDSLKCIKLDRSAWIWTLPGKLFIVRTRTACLPACHRPPRHNDVTQPKRFTVQHWRRAGACRWLRRTWQ